MESRVKKLQQYLMNIIKDLDTNYKQINVDFLDKDEHNYSIDRIPTTATIENWIIGSSLCREVYDFRSRKHYSSEVINNIANIGFFETFEKVIKQKNDTKDLPDIAGIESIKCLNCGTFNNGTTNTAEFDIQIQIEYREE